MLAFDEYTLADYQDVISVVNRAVASTDPKTWWLPVRGLENAHERAFLRLIEDAELPCVLYAVPIDDMIVDGRFIHSANVTIGFISIKGREIVLTPAVSGRVYPSQLFDFVQFNVPSDAEWVLCACLHFTESRIASLYHIASGSKGGWFADTPVLSKEPMLFQMP